MTNDFARLFVVDFSGKIFAITLERRDDVQLLPCAWPARIVPP